MGGVKRACLMKEGCVIYYKSCDISEIPPSKQKQNFDSVFCRIFIFCKFDQSFNDIVKIEAKNVLEGDKRKTDSHSMDLLKEVMLAKSIPKIQNIVVVERFWT